MNQIKEETTDEKDEIQFSGTLKTAKEIEDRSQRSMNLIVVRLTPGQVFLDTLKEYLRTQKQMKRPYQALSMSQ